MNLTWYQGEFVQHLVELEVPTIIIGGKARAFHFGDLSTDLDLWMPKDNTPNSVVHRCLLEWSQRFPNHRWPPLVEPFAIGPDHMLQFPNGDVCVLTDAGDVEQVTNSVRIDILFELKGFEFDAAFTKAIPWEHERSSVRILSEDLLEPTAALKDPH